MKIDHIAIAVNDVEASAKIYQKALGIDEIEFETVESEGCKVAILPMENGRIELIQPTNDESPIKKFLDKKGQGLHHWHWKLITLKVRLKEWRDVECSSWEKLDPVLLELKLHSFIQNR